jgi:hypothetical protein
MKNSDNTTTNPYVIFTLSFLVYGGMGYLLMYYIGDEGENPWSFAIVWGAMMAVWETFGAPKFKDWVSKRFNKKGEK